MSEQARVAHPSYSLLPPSVEGFDSLVELALDLRWSWNHGADDIWRQLDPDALRVELYADGIAGGGAERRDMRRDPGSDGADGCLFAGAVPVTRPAGDYTVRVIPRCPGVAVPLEAAFVLWQR